MLSLRRLRRAKSHNWDATDELWGGWNYPKPIYPDNYTYYPPSDGDLVRLIRMAEFGWYYCQKAFVPMAEIHPLTGYKPAISDEFRETFMSRLKDEPMPLTIYERNSKLILGTSWEEYWMYREIQKMNAACIIIGHFTERSEVALCDKPFMISPKTAQSILTT